MNIKEELKKQIDKIIDGFLNENITINEDYDLVSQFIGNHDGNPMNKNEFLNTLGLDLDGIKILQIWINLMIRNKEWLKMRYPNGTNDRQIINDIINKVGMLPSFIEKNKSINPIKVSNFLIKNI